MDAGNYEAYTGLMADGDFNYYHSVGEVSEYLWIPIVGGLTCGFMAWGIGANDTANSWGPVFGSNSLSLLWAVILASIFEAAGSFALGTNVSGTVKSGIIGYESFCTDEYSRVLRMIGMWAVLISAGTCLCLSSIWGIPVSTTHAAVGGTAGFGIVTRGWNGINWNPAMIKIFIAWVTGPLVGAVGGFILMFLFKRFIMGANRGTVWKRTVAMVPVLAGLTIGTTVLFAVAVGGKHSFSKDMHIWVFIVIFLGTWVATIPAAWVFYKFYIPYLGLSRDMDFQMDAQDAEQPSSASASLEAKGLEEDYPPHFAPYPTTTPEPAAWPQPVPNADKEVEEYEASAAEGEDPMASLSTEVQTAERLFKPLAIMIACSVSFAHGANDVSNAIGPYGALMDSYNNKCPSGTKTVQYWILAIGAVGIVFGLATLGWKVMDTVGKKVTKVTPSRAYITELSAALSIMIATWLAIPVSTSHTSVGALTGMAIAQDGIKSVNWKIIGLVCVGIVATVPLTALYAGALTGFLHAIIFGAAYPPQYAFCQAATNASFCPIHYGNITIG